MASQGYNCDPSIVGILTRLDERVSALERTRTIPVGTGAPTTAPADGAQYGDITHGIMYLRLGGAWVAYGAGGSGNVTWPGSNRLTTATTVAHNLSAAPSRILLGSASSNLALSYANITATTFDVIGNTVDGSSPANGTSRAFSWEASL